MKNLIPVVAQDVKTNAVLMVAFADAEAIRRTRKTGFMHYWSRSRNRLWKKGETSGHVQKVVTLHYDCDRDTILARVEQTGPACHKGTFSCFSKKPFDLESAFDHLESVFAERKKSPKKGSHTSKLLADPELLRRKVIEEVTELLMATKFKNRKNIAEEAADVLYHVTLLMYVSGVRFRDALDVLERRRR